MMEFEEVGSFESGQDGGQTIFDFLNTNQSIHEIPMGDQFNLPFDFLTPPQPLNPLGDSGPFSSAFCDPSLTAPSVLCDQSLPSPHSEILDSIASSPVLSPSPAPVESPYSAESGIEDDADMEDCSPLDFIQTDLNAGPVVTRVADVPMCPAPTIPAVSSPAATSSPSSPRSRNHTSSRRTHSRTSSQEEATTATLASVQQELQNLINRVGPSAQPIMTTEAFSFPDTPVVNAVTGPVPATCPVSTVTYTTQDPVLIPNEVVPVSTTPVTTDGSQPLSSPMQEPVVSSKETTCVIGKNTGTPKLVIVEEPEENYRARYESEGCRGPIHGTTDNSFPTIKVDGYTGQVWISVHLVTSDGQPHYHSIHGPGSTKVPCKEMKLQGVPAVQVMVAPDTDMTAILDSLSIRRLRNWEGDRELKKRGIDPASWKKERKEACLMFQAELPGKDNQLAEKLTCLSRIFKCSTSGPAGNPEVWWASLSEGSVEGGDELGLIGKKFQTGFRVRFSAELPSGKMWKKFADVDKSKSHQGAAVLQVPPFCDLDISAPVTVSVEVVTGSERDPKYSDAIEFTYKPRVKRELLNGASLPLKTTGQDSSVLGGLGTSLLGGMTTVTTVQNGALAGTLNCESSMATATPTVSTAARQFDNKDWTDLCTDVKQLYQAGELSLKNITSLVGFIERQDTVLLEAFRSSRNSGTLSECRTKFKQYLSGLLPRL